MKKITITLLVTSVLVFMLWKLQGPSSSLSVEETEMTVLTKTKTPIRKTLIVSKESVSEESSEGAFDHSLKTLPTADDLGSLSEEEVHHTPEMIINGGEVIARVEDEAQDNPSLRGDALSFLKKCVEDQEIVDPIRAVCLNKIYKLIPQWQMPLPLDHSLISEEVSELAHKLP